MAIFTKQQFENKARNKAGYTGLSAHLTENRAFSKSLATTSIFLSHSHKDRPIVEQAKVFFQNLGLSIYVDWADETMPEKTNGITAAKIKIKIKDNDKFILLATNDAVSSKWCNWEVGIGDSYKLNNDKICVLPLADNSKTWDGNEYLQIYPRIEESEYTDDYYKVIYPNGSTESLNDWLKK
ncbi:toll/interleukin-1 receptor domain-containing protein [Mucilaginibacter sp. UR6-1]|uniref:toll/interleukin-1 receptor domain-containing protein n=1 Tax=Mucilaginibacter sp. UR6-1 TaxID=1435643 RepID=UPI001E533E35|nr:toll/interleukin-1 receptor domain-containing protein [Mucilaginibacter sp. UR6-1]MCC8410996.1 toll/interleukin-1 receptor domain-containing protein [Mucilaginibacter sp. UR6-1]